MKIFRAPYTQLSVLIGLNLVVFVFLGLLSLFSAGGIVSWLVMRAPVSAWIAEPWGLATYMFVQIDFLHLLFNMLWLLSFGVVMCRFGRERRLYATYFISGLAGSLSFLVIGQMDQGGVMALYGSSSAVLGVIAACAALFPRLRLNMVLFGSVELRWLALVALILCGIAPGLGSIPTLIAHIAGAVAGYVYGALSSRRSFRLPRRNDKRIERTKRGGAINVRQHQKRGLKETDQAELDLLLQRVSKSGYKSLSMSERHRLFELSNKINEPKLSP